MWCSRSDRGALQLWALRMSLVAAQDGFKISSKRCLRVTHEGETDAVMLCPTTAPASPLPNVSILMDIGRDMPIA